jgi:spermidine/putrescine transport system substrate-binding protein
VTQRDIERLIDAEISRRWLLRQAGAGMTALSFASFLAACGGDGGIEDNGGGGDKSEEAEVIPKGEVSDSLNFSNWPLYIDEDGETSLDKFEKRYGTKVKYTEEINDNTEFFGKVRQIYARGDSGGRDLHVVTDWMASKMKQLGYVQKLDKSELPNVDANLLDSLREPSFDPTREFSVPWQTGIAAIVYRKDLVGELTSINDFFDPKFKGKATMLTEMRDSVGLTMLSLGFDPSSDGVDEALEAIDKIDKAQKDGHIRRFTGNDYTKDLLKGDVHVAVGWSGDAVQLKADNPDVELLLPEEGFMLWSDNMQVPVGAPHAYTAQKLMDFVYEPAIAAQIAAYVNYITPVKGAQEEMRKLDPELAENPLIFPSDTDLERSFIFRELDAEEDRELTEAFQTVIGA